MSDSIPTNERPEYIRFGKNIARARKDLKLSQEHVASLLGVSQSTYASYETASRKVPLSIIVKLAEILKKTPDELLGTNEKINNKSFLTVYGFEKDLVVSYRKADELDKAIVKRTLKLDDVSPNQKKA